MPVPDAMLRAVDENVVGRRNGYVGAEERRLAERLRRRLAAAPV